MHNSKAASLLGIFSLGLLMLLFMSSCETDPCEDAICSACPSSRLLIQYQDSTGMCPPSFHTNATVTGIDLLTQDTALNYNFSDSCLAGLLIRENYRYIIRSGAYTDVVDILGFTYQDPVSVTECCLCYPVASLSVTIDGDSSTIDFPASQYDNTPLVISIN